MIAKRSFHIGLERKGTRLKFEQPSTYSNVPGTRFQLSTAMVTAVATDAEALGPQRRGLRSSLKSFFNNYTSMRSCGIQKLMH